MWRKLLALAVGAACAVAAAAHGMLAEPRARNVVHNSNYCPHCLAAGGPGVTYAGGRVWPNSLHGVCGDPHTGPLDHEAGGKFATKVITGTYLKGQRITLRIKITAPHGGRFSFGVCPLPDSVTDAEERKLVTQKCFDSNRLLNVEDNTPYWWFGKKPTGEYAMDFKLPPTVHCKRCVLQWHYESGNSCTIPGTPQQHVMSANMVSCDQSSAMEEFWNCADITIKDAEGGDEAATPEPPKKRKNKLKKARGAQDDSKEGFAPFEAAAHPYDGGYTGGSVLVEIATVALVVALVSLAIPPLVATAVGVGFGVWYLVYRRSPGGGGPRLLFLPDRTQLSWKWRAARHAYTPSHR